MKSTRQRLILDLIKDQHIDTQESLMEKLTEMGISVTQTTISRDIRDLNLIKVSTPEGSYHYVVSSDVGIQAKPALHSGVTDSILSVVAAGNIVVMKTHPGMANAVAVLIDSLRLHDILGTVAGDDTILMVVPDAETAHDAVKKIKDTLNV